MTEVQIEAFRAVRQAWRSHTSDQHIPENYYFTSLLRCYSEAAIREAIFFTAKFVRRQIDARKEVTLEDAIRYCAAGEKYPAGARRGGRNPDGGLRMIPAGFLPRDCRSEQNDYAVPRCEECRQTFRGAAPIPRPEQFLPIGAHSRRDCLGTTKDWDHGF